MIEHGDESEPFDPLDQPAFDNDGSPDLSPVDDGLYSPDILPTPEYADAEPPAVDIPVPAAFTSPHGRTFEQIHTVDDVYHTKHPDRTYRIGLPVEVGIVERGLDGFHNFVNQHNHSKDFTPYVEPARERLVGDFGPRMGDLVISVLLPEDLKAAKESGLPNVSEIDDRGVYLDGRIVVATSVPEQALFGEGVVVGDVLRNGAQASQADERVLITSDRFQAGRWSLRHPQLPKYHVRSYMLGGFVEYDPTQPWGAQTKGHFWEQGFADSYRVRSLAAMGRPVRFEGGMADADIDGVSLGLASESARARHIDAGTGRLNIPAEYADAYYSPPKPDVRRAPVFEERGLAAYALDLLDQRLPGLYDTMVASREDPQLVGRVKERIDGISPGLYDYLAAPLVTSTGYAEKLTAVVKMLGLENEPVRHLHGLY